MELCMTRREMLAGCLAGLGLTRMACVPLAYGATVIVSSANSDGYGFASNAVDCSEAEGPEMRRIIWHGLAMDIPAALEWNESGAYDGAALDASVYSGMAGGVNHIVYAIKWQENDFVPTVWESLLSCDPDTWVGIAANNDTLLGGYEILDTGVYDNDGLKVVAVRGFVDGNRIEKKVCCLVTDGCSAWYICLVFNDGGFDDESALAADRILGSVEVATEDDVFSGSEWQLGYYSDKYGEPTDDSFIMTDPSIDGTLSSSETLGTKVSARIYVDWEGYVFVRFWGVATGKAVQGEQGGSSFEGSVRAGDGTEADIAGWLEQDSGQIWLDAESCEKVIGALQGGGRVSFLLKEDDSVSSTFTFSLDATNRFQEAYMFIRE